MEADALSRIDWEKYDESIPANSIQAIVAAAITRNLANHIEAIPCSPQTINPLLPFNPDTPIVSKAITQSSGQSCLMCLESELSVLKTLSKPDDSSCPGIDNDPLLNPKCMTTLDLIEAQSKDKTIGENICLFRAKELQHQKGKETDSQEIRQFIRQ